MVVAEMAWRNPLHTDVQVGRMVWAGSECLKRWLDHPNF